jgi:hypothetical protein
MFLINTLRNRNDYELPYVGFCGFYRVPVLCYPKTMWKLAARGERGSPFVELGDYASLAEAARSILKAEDRPDGALFFRVYVDPLMPATDADALRRLEYQSDTHFYVLTQPADLP